MITTVSAVAVGSFWTALLLWLAFPFTDAGTAIALAGGALAGAASYQERSGKSGS